MTKKQFIRAAIAGGPGLCAYVYEDELYCIACGEDACHAVSWRAPLVEDDEDPLFSDRWFCPQPIFEGESDFEEFCSVCGAHLYGGDPEDANDYC
jgi:hypothetical protein